MSDQFIERVSSDYQSDESLEKSIELIHSLMTQNPLDNLISDIYKENGYEGYAQKIMGAWINIKEKLENAWSAFRIVKNLGNYFLFHGTRLYNV